MQRRWLWAGGLVLGGYQPPAAATLRLGPSFGIGRRELLMCWGAAYAAAATGLALQLVQLAPAMNQVCTRNLMEWYRMFMHAFVEQTLTLVISTLQ